MAKKKASRAGFNMSAEIRALLKEDSNLAGKDVVAALAAKFPGEKINENSCHVAFSNARKALGLRKKGRKSVRRKKPVEGRVRAVPVVKPVDMDTLKAARKYVSEVGDAQKAVAAIHQLTSLQIQ